MRYVITATLGPGSDSPAVWRAMLSAGATAFRLNTSHLSLDQLADWLKKIREFRKDNNLKTPVVLDLQGSKWRLGDFSSFELKVGERLELVFGDQASAPHQLPVPHVDFFRAVRDSQGEIILNDAKSRLVILSAAETGLTARVEVGGMISAHKGITLADTHFRVEAISEKDSQVVEMAIQESGVRFAVSYVRDSEEMKKYRHNLGSGVYLVAKLERAPAMIDVREISKYCDEMWVCRGDLGAELGLVGMAKAVSAFAPQVAGLPVPVMMAGQVLEHMVTHPEPTRSEVCYLLEVLRQGYSGFVLSDEAAIGRFPVESCRAAAMFF